MNIQLSEHFNYKKLLRFTLPSIVMMIFTSVYSVVDGFFVSNFVGKTPFAAVNFIMPFLMVLGAFGFMFGTGGSALISKTMGEGDNEKAKHIFSLLIYVSIGCGVVIAVLGIIFIRPVAALLGAEGEMLDNCVLYGRIILAALPAFMLQYEFQSLFVTAEKPQLGLAVTVAAGVTNMVLDALLVAVFSLGLVGAAAATALSQCVGGLVPLVYFGCKNSSALRLTRTEFDGRALLRTCTNGISELLSNISMSIVGILFNMQLIKYSGENGVAAYGVLMYVNFIFLAIFIGYSVGTAPLIGYNYGSGNHEELKNLLKRSLWIIGITSVAMVVGAKLLARPLAAMYVGYDIELFELTLRGFTIYSLSFLFSGMAIFGSSFFTALNNGLISALISFLRTIVFEVSGVLLIPIILVSFLFPLSIVVANGLAAFVTVLFLLAKRKQYRY